MYEQKSLDLTSLLLSSIASRVLTSQSVSITCICVTKWWHITRAISLFTPHGICLQILTHKSCEWSPGSSSSSRRFYSPYKKVLERFIEFISLLFPPICHAVWSVFRRMIDEKYVVYTSTQEARSDRKLLPTLSQRPRTAQHCLTPRPGGAPPPPPPFLSHLAQQQTFPFIMIIADFSVFSIYSSLC